VPMQSFAILDDPADACVRELGISEDLDGARLLLSMRSGNGYFAAYAALIDNRTGDPRTLLPSF